MAGPYRRGLPAVERFPVQPRRRAKRQGSVTLIDLGEIGAFDEEPPDPVRPRLPRWVRRLGVPDWPKLVAAGVLAALAGGLAGTAPGTAPDPTVYVVPGVSSQSSVALVGDVLVDALDGGLAGYDVLTGEQLWNTVLGQDVGVYGGVNAMALYQLGPTPGFEVAAPSVENLPRSQARGSLNAVDARTGVLRWHHPGALLGPVAPTVMVMLVPSDAVPGGPIGGWLLVGVDAHDGHDRWSQAIAGRTRWTFPYEDPDTVDTSRFLLVAPDGALSTVDSTTGRATTLGRIPADATVDWSWNDTVAIHWPDPIADLIFPPLDPDHPDEDQGPELFAVYQLSDLGNPLWRRPIPDRNTPWPCEANTLCLWQGNDLGLMDLRTGDQIMRETYTEFRTPGAFGVWQVTNPITIGKSEAVAALPPAWTKTKEGWLGLIRIRQSRPQILPLVRIPFLVDTCWYGTAAWIICTGDAGTIAIRRSEFDAMVAATSGKPS
jgi:hypothetical protein